MFDFQFLQERESEKRGAGCDGFRRDWQSAVSDEGGQKDVEAGGEGHAGNTATDNAPCAAYSPRVHV